METDKLAQFCTIVDTGSLTQAAELLGISLSGLSKSMRTLQEELGFEIFIQKGRGVLPSEKGQELYKQSYPLLEKIHGLYDIEKQTDHTIRIGGLEVFTQSLLGKNLLKDFPNHFLSIVELSPGELERALISKTIDAGVTYFPIPQEEIEYLKIKKIELKVFTKKSTKNQSIEQLSFILPLSTSSPQVTDHFDKDGWPELKLPRKYIIKTNRLSIALNLLEEKDNFAIFIPSFLAKELEGRVSLQQVNLPKKIGKIYRDIFLVKRKTDQERRIHKVVSKIIRTSC